MSMVLDHAIARARNKERSVAFFANIMGLNVDGPFGLFTKVRVNEDLALLFDDRFDFAVGHFAFLVDDRRIAYRDGGSVVYMRDSDGNSYELLTAAW